MKEIMDYIDKSQKLKLKPIKISELLFKNRLKTDINIYNIKTERSNDKARNKFINLGYKNPFLNTINNTSLYKNNNPIINLKYKSPVSKNNFPRMNQIINNKNNKKQSKRNSISLNQGYNNYLKEKINKTYLKMKRLLFEERIKRLTLPKHRLIINKDVIKEYKSKRDKYNSKENDSHYQLYQNYKYKKRLNNNRILEKEKIKSRKRYNTLLQNNFKKLNSCETKFNSVIDKTMKHFSEYQHSLGYVKSE